ncbi:MAG: RNA polymerase sigma factor [Actinomycetota bacterium]|nr:RNA polymerase sigma factor [Actinomycetota bacterium]
MGFNLVMDEMGRTLAADLDGSFQAVVEKMGTRIYWGLRRMSNNHQEAEDLTQETFIKAWSALLGYDKPRIRALRVEPWLWTIALNLGRNNLRNRSRRPTFVELAESPVDDPELADGVAWDRRLKHLNRHQRTAVVLRHVIGLGSADIAEATGRPEGTVKADIHRGLARLRQVMEDEQ